LLDSHKFETRTLKANLIIEKEDYFYKNVT